MRLDGIPSLAPEAVDVIALETGVSPFAVMRAAARRDWRWIVLLPRHVAFVAEAEGHARLAREAEVLEAFHAAAGDVVPRVVASEPDRGVQIRTRVPGRSGAALHALEPGARERLARTLGATLARLHDAARLEGLAALSLDVDALDAGVRAHGDEALARVLSCALAWWEARTASPVLLHGDVRDANVVADAAGELRGLVDVDRACVGDPIHDLRHLHAFGPRFVALALEAYGARAPAPDDVARAHVLAALEQAAYADATRADDAFRAARAAAHALVPAWTG